MASGKSTKKEETDENDRPGCFCIETDKTSKTNNVGDKEDDAMPSACQTGVPATADKWHEQPKACTPLKEIQTSNAPNNNLVFCWWRKFYSPPIQREQWPGYKRNSSSSGTHEAIEPDNEWELVFLDLFYVPAVGNMAELILSIIKDIQPGVFIYFFSIFFAMWTTWYHHCIFECKFVSGPFQLVVNRFRMIFVAMAILQIELDCHEFEGSEDNTTPFYFCLGVTIEACISLLGRVETWIVGNSLVREDSRLFILCLLAPRIIFYIAATVLSNTTRWPSLILCGAMIPQLILTFAETTLDKLKFNISETVPISMDAYLSRIGSWISVILGESIVALLNRNTGKDDTHWVASLLGIATTMSLHAMYFYSKGQISSFGMFEGLLHSSLVQALSISLICISVAYRGGLETENFLKEEVVWNNQTLTIDQLVDARVLSDTARVTQNCTLSLVVEEGLVLYSEKSTIESPLIEGQYTNRLYFFSIALTLFFFEVIFWSSNTAYLNGLVLVMRSGGHGKRVFLTALFLFQAVALVIVAVLGFQNEDMYSLDAAYVYAIGFSLAFAFYIVRQIIVQFNLFDC